MPCEGLGVIVTIFIFIGIYTMLYIRYGDEGKGRIKKLKDR